MFYFSAFSKKIIWWNKKKLFIQPSWSGSHSLLSPYQLCSPSTGPAMKLSNYFDKLLLYCLFPFTPLLGSEWAILKTIYDKVEMHLLILEQILFLTVSMWRSKHVVYLLTANVDSPHGEARLSKLPWKFSFRQNAVKDSGINVFSLIIYYYSNLISKA